MIIKNNESFNLKRVNFAFLKEAFLSESLWNTIILVIFVFFLFLFSRIFKRNLNLSSRAYDQLLKNLTPKNIFDTFGVNGKKDIGANRVSINLNKTKLKDFFVAIFRRFLVMISCSWLIVFFVKLQTLIRQIIKASYISLSKQLSVVNYLSCSLLRINV